MSDSESVPEGIPEEEFSLGIITIKKVLDSNLGVYVSCNAELPSGEDMFLIDILGMLELAKDTFIHKAMGEFPND